MSDFIDSLNTLALIQGFNEAVKSPRAKCLDFTVIWPYFNAMQQNESFKLALFEQYPFMKAEYDNQVIGRRKSFTHDCWTPETSFMQTILMILYH